LPDDVLTPEKPETEHQEQQAKGGQHETNGIAGRQSIAEQNPGNNPKKGYFSKFKNWVSLFTLLLVGTYTVLTYCALLETRRSVVASTRAWVGPYEVSVDGIGPQSETANIVLKYKNAGKEPALNFNDSYNDDWTGTLGDGDNIDLGSNCLADDPDGKPSKTTCADRINRWVEDHCWNKPPYEHRAIYPEFSDTTLKPFTITKDRIGKKKIGFLQGCFIYRSRVTGDADHRSAFCYFEQFVSDLRPHPMRSCPQGNMAN
jgi:hypothetical protein